MTDGAATACGAATDTDLGTGNEDTDYNGTSSAPTGSDIGVSGASAKQTSKDLSQAPGHTLLNFICCGVKSIFGLIVFFCY